MAQDSVPTSIFLSYRRDDSFAHVNALFLLLREHFGRARIFKDTENIPAGRDVRKAIESQLRTCSVMLVIIGPQWLSAQKTGTPSRRLDDPNDYLRIEVATALKDDRVLVIPILVGQATMPQPEGLPSDLQQLSYLNGFELRDSRWESDVRLLVDEIERAGTERRRPDAGHVSGLMGQAKALQMLSPGTRVGPYEVQALIGRGGMGEVYRARDAKLQRDVALKVLPGKVADERDRVERLSREAKVLASLNHRKIAAVYGFEDSGPLPALVMELVDGPTLADQLAQGPLPIDVALRIARQIAEALEAAHAQGIIHRDLKPPNIKVRPDGEVKVLDFGLAKAWDTGHADDSVGDRSTATTHPVTDAGVVVGTGPYLSPEQARGGTVDRSTDLWAFGVVLCEMLTGKQLFRGATLSDSIAAVLNTEPDWTTLPRATPPSIRRLLSRCLQKDRLSRLDSAIVARLEIDEALNPQDNGAPTISTKRQPLVVAGVVGVGIVVAALLAGDTLNRARSAPEVVHVRADLGADLRLRRDLSSSVIVSPDGQTLVYSTEPTNVPGLLYVRQLDQLTATPLRGTENARSPFFSPDGQWVAFFAPGTLKKIPISGGTAVTICETPVYGGGTWLEDGTIVFNSVLDSAPQLLRVPASGGTPVPLTTLQPGEITHRWPQALPRNRGILYTSNTSHNWDDARLVVHPLPAGAPKVVQPGTFGRYVDSGHILFVKGGTLYAVPFDLNRLEVTGPSAALSDNVAADVTTGGAQFDVSATGILAFLQGGRNLPTRPAVWMERGGNTITLRSDAVDWANPRFSTDGGELAFDIHDGTQIDVWVQHLAPVKLTRLTFERADDYKPVLTPDGQRVAFTSARDGVPNLYWQRVDGTGSVERLTSSANQQASGSWHPSGRFLAFQENTPRNGADILILPVDRDGEKWKIGTPQLFAGGSFNESEPSFSPDGRWLAYTSNELGRAEIFVRSLDDDGKWQVSRGGGRDAAWSPARRELVYFSTTENRIMVAPYTLEGRAFVVGSARPWATTLVGRPSRDGRTFDLHPDGERVVVVPADVRDTDRVNLVFNFFERLRALAPPIN